jgi:hypothetical protein
MPDTKKTWQSGSNVRALNSNLSTDKKKEGEEITQRMKYLYIIYPEYI